MVNVAFIGSRGMVGSVLLGRMRAEGDFVGFTPLFGSTSEAGSPSPDVGLNLAPLFDAFDIKALRGAHIIVTCQGSGYTNEIYPALRASGWDGFWVDASSALRMDEDSVIVLDPVNRHVIDDSIREGKKNYIGGNCTVSLMLMALAGLFRENLVEWITSMTYQAASGAGAKNMRELVSQMAAVGKATEGLLADPASAALDIDCRVLEVMNDPDFPIEHFGAPLAGNLIPWIDVPMEGGQSREEWKGFAETNKILGCKEPIPIDGICVRIGTMRCHSQALTIKLKKDVPVNEIEEIVSSGNDWVRVIRNDRQSSTSDLCPAKVSGKLDVPVGRLRKLNIGPKYLTAFTVGDQLLWGAAEPLRRILRILLENIKD